MATRGYDGTQDLTADTGLSPHTMAATNETSDTEIWIFGACAFQVGSGTTATANLTSDAAGSFGGEVTTDATYWRGMFNIGNAATSGDRWYDYIVGA